MGPPPAVTATGLREPDAGPPGPGADEVDGLVPITTKLSSSGLGAGGRSSSGEFRIDPAESARGAAAAIGDYRVAGAQRG